MSLWNSIEILVDLFVLEQLKCPFVVPELVIVRSSRPLARIIVVAVPVPLCHGVNHLEINYTFVNFQYNGFVKSSC